MMINYQVITEQTEKYLPNYYFPSSLQENKIMRR